MTVKLENIKDKTTFTVQELVDFANNDDNLMKSRSVSGAFKELLCSKGVNACESCGELDGRVVIVLGVKEDES